MNSKRFLILWISFCLAGCSAVGTAGQPQTGAVPQAPVNTSAPAAASPPAAAAISAATTAPTATTPPQTAAASPTQAQPTAAQPTAAVQPTQPLPLPTNTLPAASVPLTGQNVQIPVETLLDYNVADSGGVLVGEVKDLVISQGTNGVGQIPYVVISSNLREDFEIPVPWKYIQIRPDMQSIVLPATSAQIANAPAFHEDTWPSSFNAANTTLQSFWANPAQAGMVQFPAGGVLAADYLRAKDVMDLDINSQQGIELGKIKDIAIDWTNSQPGGAVDAATFNYVILELDDNVNPAEPMVPIPWRLVRMAPRQESTILNLAPTVFQNVPSFTKGTWPNLYAEPLSTQLSQFWNNK